MAEGNSTHVSYEAIAQFNDLHKALRKTRSELAKTQAAEKAFNEESAKSYANTAQAFKESIKAEKSYNQSQNTTAKTTRQKTEALKDEAAQLDRTRKANVRFVESVGQVNEATGEIVENTDKAIESTNRWGGILDKARQFMSRHTTEVKANTAAQNALTNAKERQSDATESLRISELRLAEIMKKSGQTASSIAAAEQRVARARRAVQASTVNVENAIKRMNSEGGKLPPTFRRIQQGGDRLFNSMQKFANWRPRLVPPFIALIPIIGGVVAAINPLIALMGSLGSVAIGLAGSIGSLSGAFIALPGILSGVVAGISSVIASMGGVGSVFKTYSAMQKATNSARGGASGGGGSNGPTQADRAEALADAERNLARAQKGVQKAQEGLNKAREQALEDLIELRLEVSRASLNEERAIASLRQAQEEYWNVMADPGSTLGDKLDAAASVKEAEADLQDVRKENISNQKKLNEAEKKGIDNSDQVVEAQERLVDAIEAQKDAQRALNKEQTGGGINAGAGASAATTAVNEFNEALAKLSPSARKFVLAILAMQKQWEGFKREMQETFFSQFVDDLDRLPRLLNSLTNFLRPSAKAMGQFVSAFLEMLDSPEWSNDLSTIGEQNATVVSALGDAFLSLSTALKDVIIAAGPFTEWMVKGFAEGSKNFSEFVGSSRETGQLATWLDKVAERMQKWWTVVKNVGATIFNYSAAAEDFGGWLLDGFVELSEAWRIASEEARKEGSPFREYLEEIQPLLTEIKGLFGDFFGWLREEMMDPENIQDAQDLVKLLRDDLGPALGRLLDTLADTDIDEKFIKAISSIIESLDSVLENGGGEAFETFFDVVVAGFEALAEVVQFLSDSGMLSPVLKFLGFMAGLTFVGKFTGLTTLLGAITGFGGNKTIFKSLSDMFKGFKDLDKAKFTSLLGKAGLFAGIAGVVLTLGIPTVNNLNNTRPVREKIGLGSETLTPENARDVLENDVDNGTLLKSTGLPGIISEMVSGFDDLFGTEAQEEFDRWLGDITAGLVDFVEWWLPKWNGFWEELPNAWTNLGELWDGFWTGLETNWNYFLVGLGVLWTNFWTPIATWWDKNVGQPLANAWHNVQVSFTTGWLWIQTNVVVPFQVAWARVSAWFDENVGKPIRTSWQNVQNFFSSGWNWINNNVITPFKNGFNVLTSTIGGVVDGMGRKWAELRRKFAEPVNFVIDTVYNNGIRSFWNGINNSLGLGLSLGYVPPVRFADGGVMPAPTRRQYATGGVLPGYTPGRDVHDFVSPTGGRLSLSGGEAIMRPEFTKLVGGKKGVDELNKKAIRGQAFAKGGVFNGGKTQHFAKGGMWEVAGDVWDKFSNFFSNPLGTIKDGLNNLISPLLSKIGGGNFGKMIGKLPGKAIDGLANFAKGKADKATRKTATITPNGDGMKWQSMWAAVQAAFPNARLHGGYRDPARNARVGGAKGSYHTRGRAIDVTPSMEIFNWIKKNYPGSRELIYSPAGGQQLLNGQNHFWSGAVRAMHYNHVHWAMKNGGVIPGLYDNGGWLPNGGMAVNKSGKPEAVLDPQESRALKALLSGSGLSARPAFGASAATAIQSAPQQIIDYSVTVEKLEINNPVPETVSESLPRAIRRAGYMNEARTGR